MCAIQTNIYVAFTVLCLLSLSANCFATHVAADDERTTLPGAELQSLMSYMMSMSPPNATEDLLGGKTEGIKHEPNLGYEPYWYSYNLVELNWEKKCRQCSKLFQNFTKVCAVDGLGNMYVNVSMCGMMRQNCLAGTAYGNTTGIRMDFSNSVFVVQDGWARFAIKLQWDLRIILSSSSEAKPPFYTIILDGWDGFQSKLYRDNDRSPSAWFTSTNDWNIALGSSSEYTEFVIRWNTTSGWILMTKSSYTNWTQGFFFNWTDPNPFSIKFIGISSNEGHRGEFIVKDLPQGFVVTSLGPCADTPQGGAGVPRQLTTFPTAVPPIIENYSTFNKGYYARMNESGFDVARQAFSTREEY